MFKLLKYTNQHNVQKLPKHEFENRKNLFFSLAGPRTRSCPRIRDLGEVRNRAFSFDHFRKRPEPEPDPFGDRFEENRFDQKHRQRLRSTKNRGGVFFLSPTLKKVSMKKIWENTTLVGQKSLAQYCKEKKPFKKYKNETKIFYS